MAALMQILAKSGIHPESEVRQDPAQRNALPAEATVREPGPPARLRPHRPVLPTMQATESTAKTQQMASTAKKSQVAPPEPGRLHRRMDAHDRALHPKLRPPEPGPPARLGPSGPFYPHCNQLNLKPKLNKWLRLLKNHKSLCPSRAAPAAMGTHTTAPSIASCTRANPARPFAPGPFGPFYPQCNQLNLHPKLNKWFRLAKSSKSRRTPRTSRPASAPVPPIT
ncbi:hypothetical protein SBA4_2730005 [Candidatus Sulfopaludibacter sp. SbA4]|nr:hypothetical protein SBA4_2730005 [Candidatus Sulfopaludibacter sp. SbA4]